MTPVTDTLLAELTRKLVAEFRPERVILFGSRAWGEPGPDSAVDLLVIVAQSEERPAARATRALHALRGAAVPLDILVKTRAEFERFLPVTASLEAQIARQGRILYG